MTDTYSLRRCALNQATINNADLRTTVAACEAADIPALGVWRRQLSQAGSVDARRMLRGSGLQVTSLCRGGFFTSVDTSAWRTELDDNRRAIEQAHDIGAPVLVLVAGGVDPGSTILDAHARVRDAVEALAPDALAADVTLAVEPMHPVFASDRGVISTLEHALDLVGDLPAAAAGVAVDSYHVWWDRHLDDQLRRAASLNRLALVQVADWAPPQGEPLTARAFPGDGVIDYAHFISLVDTVGYDGHIEWEIFNTILWEQEPAEVTMRVAAAHRRLIAPHLHERESETAP